MSNLVEYIVKIRDLASGQWKGFANAGEGAFNRLNNRMHTVGNNVDQLNAKINALTKTRNMSINTSQIAQANREIDKLEAKRDRLQNKGRFSSGFGGLLGQGLALAGIGGGAYLAKDIMQMGMERQMNLVALQTLLGTNNGNRINGQLLEFAKKSIYGNEVFTEGKLMAGSGIASNNIMPVMRMIGDIAMGDKERMKSLALAFSEANTRGSLSGVNERMFLQGGLFNPLQQLHLMTGRNMGDLKKDMEKGKISIDMLVKSMEYATGPMGRYYQMMQKMQDTPAGKWTAFTGTIRTMAGTLGESLLPALGKTTDFLTGLINNKNELYGIAAAIGGMTVAWGLYSVAANWAAISSGAAEIAAAWPLAAIGAVVYAVTTLNKLTGDYSNDADTITGKTGDISKAIKGMADDIQPAFNPLKHYFESLRFFIQGAWLDILVPFERINKAMLTHPDKGGGWWSGLKNFAGALTSSDGTDADRKLNYLSSLYQWQIGSHGPITPVKLSASWYKNHKQYGTLGNTANTPTVGQYTPTLAGGGAPAAVADTARGISGGGVRNQTINIAKLGTDTITIHTTNLREGTAEIQRMFIEMFNQVINSGNAAVSSQ